MKIEILYSEKCCLFGDIGNVLYLKKCLPKHEFIYTKMNTLPLFFKEKIDLVYLGPMPESTQEKIIELLKPHKTGLENSIKQGQAFLFTGNSWEIMGKYIEKPGGERIEALNIFDIYTKRDMINRHNELVLGTYKSLEIVGFKSQFTQTYGNNENQYFLKVKKGTGLNKSSFLEGIKVNNFFGTYLLGPILPLNPLFTKQLFKEIGIKNFNIAFEKTALKAYNKRLEEFKNL